MAYQSLVDLPLNRSRSSQLSCLGSGIPSLVGGFSSKKRNPLDLRQPSGDLCQQQRSYVEYPPEGPRPPSPEELREMARELARNKNIR
ncbi:hypothetical protein WN943_028933 [Citrus x changshan-huyou]